MRAIVPLAMLASCADPEPAPEPHRTPPNLPRVGDPTLVIAPANAPYPAAFVWVNTKGRLEIAETGPLWRGEPPAERTPIDEAALREAVLRAALATARPAIHDEAQRLLAGDPLPPDGFHADTPPRARTSPVVALAKLPPVAPLVLAAPTTPADAVARVVAITGGSLAVSNVDQASVLALGLAPVAPHDTAAWIQALPTDHGVALSIMPDDTNEEVVELRDPAVVKQAYARIAKITGLVSEVDILVGSDTTAQQLVDTVIALHGAGANALFVGPFDGKVADQVHRVGRSAFDPNAVTTARPNVSGDLDPQIVRRYIRRNLARFQFCYERVLLRRPGLEGTVASMFFISPDGKVTAARAAGVDPEVARCVADVLQQIEFPKPRGGGGVQVSYPFRFRPTP